ncbi:hypothetical protein L6164_023744 [Bauhinia variegata]|uniref:Uncharacterized protein n=1 Tax=Bauhinia variegata TaxID=167791 RepID=A0ACB9MJG8_BAUVA|nr:hypothetical protein L6164_023744 [Bauhinia variegata]
MLAEYSNTISYSFQLMSTMANSSTLHFFFLFIALFSVSSLSATPNAPKPKSQSIIIQVKKDPATNQYYTSLGIGTPRHYMDLVIDLGGEKLWYNCDTGYNSSSYIPVACGSKQCPQSSLCVGCNNFPKPGCTNNTCGIYVFNPLGDYRFSGDMGDDVLFLPQMEVPHFLSGCSDGDRFASSFLVGLVKSARGIVGIARTELALQTQLSSAFNLPNKFFSLFTFFKGEWFWKHLHRWGTKSKASSFQYPTCH